MHYSKLIKKVYSIKKTPLLTENGESKTSECHHLGSQSNEHTKEGPSPMLALTPSCQKKSNS